MQAVVPAFLMFIAPGDVVRPAPFGMLAVNDTESASFIVIVALVDPDVIIVPTYQTFAATTVVLVTEVSDELFLAANTKCMSLVEILMKRPSVDSALKVSMYPMRAVKESVASGRRLMRKRNSLV